MKRKQMWLYVIGAQTPDGAGVLKVGISVSPETRLKTIQTGCPYRCQLINKVRFIFAETAKRVEAAAHERFAEYRLVGEWFAMNSVEVAQQLRGFLDWAALVAAFEMEAKKPIAKEVFA